MNEAGGTPPILVEVLRGGSVESHHRGSYAVTDARGRVVVAAGSIEEPVYPRSAVKPLQALPLIETGAADAAGLLPRQIALACASHKAEPSHVDAVRSWLAAIGLDEGALECGAHPPGSPDAAAELTRQGQPPSPAHNNCSGKHTGFLCTAVHLGEDPRGYIGRDHPVQRRVAAALAEMTGVDLEATSCGCDGCGIPTYGIPLHGLARGMARMADTSDLSPKRAAAATRILDAMAAEPFYVSGSESFVTECMRVAGDSVRVKTGAEGVYAAALPHLGYGVALKIDDGASRASELAMAALLKALGCFTEAQERALDPYLNPVIRNVVGGQVGTIRATPAIRA